MGCGLVSVVVDVFGTDFLEELVVLGTGSGDNPEARDMSELDSPLTDSGASGPDENLGCVTSDFDGTFRVVRHRERETVEESLVA